MRLKDTDAIMEALDYLRDSADKTRIIELGVWTGITNAMIEMDNAPTICKWHDPDEELPTTDGEYLCLYPVKTIPPHWGIAIYEWRGKHFYCHDTEYGDAMVTGMYYWMEIPPMPKMKGEKEYVTDGNAET